MTTDEANLVRFIEHRGGLVSDTAISRQFGQNCSVALSSLLRHQHIEQDGHYYRRTSVGEEDLTQFDEQGHHIPFENRPGW